MNTQNSLQEQLKKELEFYKKLESQILSKPNNVVEGTLHIARKCGHPQYYHYIENEEGTCKRVYIRKKNISIAQKLAQKSYDEHMLAQIQNHIRHLSLLVRDYNSDLLDYYLSMPEERKSLITPIIPDDETFIKTWYQSHPGMQNNFPYHNTYLTNKKEPVRSKSEKIIADMFDKYHIPYVYEPRIETKHNSYFIPDFLTLNVRLRKTYIYDHFGMMGNEEYANNTLAKLSRYSSNHYIFGKNMLYSMESQENPLDIYAVEQLIKEYLL